MSRFARRAALRATVSAGLAASVALAVPGRRRGDGIGAGATAGALVVGAALELPAAGLAASVIAAAGLVRSRPPGIRALAGLTIGGAGAYGLRRVWPVPPRTAAEVRRTRSHISSQPEPDGDGLSVVVNAAAGPDGEATVADRLRERLPGATVIEVEEGGDLGEALSRTSGAGVVGIAGGDGSINAAADVARSSGRPLFVIPAGTLNHFARDLGVEGVDDAIDALRAGDAVAVDTGTIDGRTFVNTASFGAYSDLVDARERLESTIGKWPALVVALARLLRTGQPLDVELDGRRRRLWMVFVGNCRYSPPGFAPGWREHLDDGLLDVRLVDATNPYARTRLLLAVLTGRLARTTVYEAFVAHEVHVRSPGAPLRLACDGETFDGNAEFTITKGPPLVVYAPASS